MVLSPILARRPPILSIQSHVAYGYVGNRAAVFPLQRRGHDVVAINTVQFSNHTGYGTWEGDAVTPDHIHRVLSGLDRRGALDNLGAILTGYIGDPRTGAVMAEWIHRLKQRNPALIYACDPVMGDTGRGFFVREGILDLFRDNLVPFADILTPNVFELAALTDAACDNRTAIQVAAETLCARAASCVVVTSVPGTDPHRIAMMVAARGHAVASVETQRFPMDPAPNGAGDLTAALFLSDYLHDPHPGRALERTARAVLRVFEETHRCKQRELAIIAAQDGFIGDC